MFLTDYGAMVVAGVMVVALVALAANAIMGWRLVRR
jgi:hypothetical protein